MILRISKLQVGLNVGKFYGGRAVVPFIALKTSLDWPIIPLAALHKPNTPNPPVVLGDDPYLCVLLSKLMYIRTQIITTPHNSNRASFRPNFQIGR